MGNVKLHIRSRLRRANAAGYSAIRRKKMRNKILIRLFLSAVVIGLTPTITSAQAPTILFPNGGEVFSQGENVIIRWTSSGTPSSVGLNILQNDNHVLGIGNIPNTGSYVWTVPTNFFGPGFKIKIYGEGEDTSDEPFSIVSPSISVLSPNGGEKWVVGQTYTIGWDSSGIPANNFIGIQLSYMTTEGLRYEEVISSQILNTGSYDWTISPGVISGRLPDQFEIRVIATGYSPLGLS
jgi:hypothetical protein